MTALLTYFLIALLVSFLCSLLESVLLSISIAHVSVMEKEGERSGVILAELKENINRPLAAILTVNTLANTVGAVGVGAQTHKIYGNEWVALASGILTFSILIFLRLFPKPSEQYIASPWLHSLRLPSGCSWLLPGLL